MGDSTLRPTLAQRRPQRFSPEVVGDQHRPEVSADALQEILFVLMEQQTR